MSHHVQVVGWVMVSGFLSVYAVFGVFGWREHRYGPYGSPQVGAGNLEYSRMIFKRPLPHNNIIAC